jgi:hypothetical protein
MVFLCTAALARGLAANAAPQPRGDVAPEQAFVEQTPFALSSEVSSLSKEPEAISIPSLQLPSEEHPAPFYQKWLEALCDLFAPGEPYARDKLKLTLGMSVGYDNNVLYSPTNRITSSTYGVNAVLDYHFGSRRLQIDSKLNLGLTYYENRPGGSNDQTYDLALSLAYQWMPRLGVTFDTHTAYLSQPSPQLIGGVYQFTGSYLFTDTTIGLNYQVRPRFSVSLAYEINGIKYDDEVINQGSGFFQQNYSLSGNWLVTPRTTLIVQYRYNPLNYYESGMSSTGQFLLVGFNQTLTPRLKCQLLCGAEHRSLENPNPDSPSSYLGPYAEGTLAYQFAPRSMLTGSMRLGTEPSGTAGVTIRRTFRAALGASHKLGSRISLDGSISFEHDNYDQPGVIPDFSQDIYAASISFRFEFARYTSVVLRDDYLLLEGSQQNSSYDRNFVSLGLEIAF